MFAGCHTTRPLLFNLSRRLDDLTHRANVAAVDLPIEMLRLSLCDLIGYFRLPDECWSHETRQSSSGALKNRQNLFQEEVKSAAKDHGCLVMRVYYINKNLWSSSLFLSQGVITLVLDCIDHLHLYSSAAHFAEAAGKEAGDAWEAILSSFYVLLGKKKHYDNVL